MSDSVPVSAGQDLADVLGIDYQQLDKNSSQPKLESFRSQQDDMLLEANQMKSSNLFQEKQILVKK